MTATGAPGPEGPRPKTAMPPLEARAPRPGVVRLRRAVVVSAVLAAAALLAGSLAWAFIVQPELRGRSDAARISSQTDDGHGVVRPSEKVTAAPSNYSSLVALPQPRRLGGEGATPDTAAAPRAHAARTQDVRSHLSEEARSSGLFFADAGREGAAAGLAPPQRQAPARDDAALYDPHALQAPRSPYEVQAGSILSAALLTAVDTSRAGPVTASITENVFDTVSGRYLLIPQGARLVGRHEGESRHGDHRAFIVWDRLILPDGKSLVLPADPGVDAEGAIGAKGQVDRRLGPLGVATLFAGAITALGEAAREKDGHPGGFLGDAGDAASITAAQVGGKIIDRELDVRPTIRLRPGMRVRVFVTRDLILEPYGP